MKKIVDYFQFLNEKELLELRINLLNDYVDKFIISESNRTHTGKRKDFICKDVIKELGLPGEKIKIIEVSVPDDDDLVIIDSDYFYSSSSKSSNVKNWTRERIQRNAILDHIDEFDEDTVFILSDCDEIIDPKVLPYFSECCRRTPNNIIKVPLISLEGRADKRVYNESVPLPWDKSMVLCTKKQLKNGGSPIKFRGEYENPYPPVWITQDNQMIQDCGWHFTWMGDKERRKIKCETTVHADNLDVYDNLSSESSVELGAKENNLTLKNYPIQLLPKVIFDLPRVKNFLLPGKNCYEKMLSDLISNQKNHPLLTKNLQNLFYDIQEFLSPDCSLEIGAYEASFSRVIKHRYPNIESYAFEANPYSYEHFINDINSKNQKINYINCAISNIDGNIDYILQDSNLHNGIKFPEMLPNNSILNRNDPNISYKTISIPSVSLDTFIKQNDLCDKNICAWIDVEGAVKNLVEGAKNTLNNIQSIFIEVEDVYFWENQWLSTEVISFLRTYNFVPVARDFEYEGQNNYIFIKKELLSEKIIDIIQKWHLENSKIENINFLLSNLYNEFDNKYGEWGWCSEEKYNKIISSVFESCKDYENPTCVEIGVYGGKSFFPFALVLKELGKGKVYGIDPWTNHDAMIGYEHPNHREFWGSVDLEQIYDIFVQGICQLDVEKHCFILRETSDAAEEIQNINVLHIDGQHTEQLLRDINKYAKNVLLNGYCFVDDVEWSEDTKKSVDLMESLGFEKIDDINGCFVYKRTRLNENIFIVGYNSSKNPTCWIVDDFYENPDEVREFALKQEYVEGGFGRGFIGRRTEQQFLFPGLKEQFEQIMGRTITAWEEHGMNGRFQIAWSGEPLVYHCDSQRWGGMLYLTPLAPYQCGTTLYANKKTRARTYHEEGWNDAWNHPGGSHLDRTPWEPVDVMGNVYNRLVIFDASCIHSASEYFGNSKENSRLWQMFFFDTE